MSSRETGHSGVSRGLGGPGLQTQAVGVPPAVLSWWPRPQAAGRSLRLGIVVGAPRLLQLALDEILLQLLPVADHELLREILQQKENAEPSGGREGPATAPDAASREKTGGVVAAPGPGRGPGDWNSERAHGSCGSHRQGQM